MSYLSKMKFIRLILCLIFSIQLFSSFAQEKKVNNVFQKQDIALLDILYKDSINPLHIQLNSSLFNFGLNTKEFRNIALLKRGKEIWIQPLGLGKVFKVKKENNNYTLVRIDSTIHSGVNFEAYSFILHNSIVQFGGTGFWHLRGILTYFSPITHEWELYPSDRIVNGYDDFKNIIKFKVDTNANKLYTTKSLGYFNMPKDYTISSIDSCYVFDFYNHQWTTLGLINPALKLNLQTATYSTYDIDDIIIYQNYLDYFWINFKTNSFGKINSTKNEAIKQIWLSLYTTKELYDDLQFNLGNTAYLLKISPDHQLSYKTFTISSADIDTNNIQYVYKIDNNLIHFFFNVLLPFFTPNVLIIMLIAFFIFFLVYRQRKKKVPKEVTARLNYNFYHSLTIIEKELLQVLYKNHQKGETISTKLINKIIGVQNKDVLTQNKSRSDHFLKINQKYKLSTQQPLPLIIKNRDTIDKRQYNYGLEPSYLVYLIKMIESEKQEFED